MIINPVIIRFKDGLEHNIDRHTVDMALDIGAEFTNDTLAVIQKESIEGMNLPEVLDYPGRIDVLNVKDVYLYDLSLLKQELPGVKKVRFVSKSYGYAEHASDIEGKILLVCPRRKCGCTTMALYVSDKDEVNRFIAGDKSILFKQSSYSAGALLTVCSKCHEYELLDLDRCKITDECYEELLEYQSNRDIIGF